MAISLASLDGYRDESQGFMEHLRLAESFMETSLASLDGDRDGYKYFMKQVHLAGNSVEMSKKIGPGPELKS